MNLNIHHETEKQDRNKVFLLPYRPAALQLHKNHKMLSLEETRGFVLISRRQRVPSVQVISLNVGWPVFNIPSKYLKMILVYGFEKRIFQTFVHPFQ